MSVQNASYPKASPGGTLTNALAFCWGLASAYVLLHGLLISHHLRPCLGAIVPLVVVWATLERKRWGRLALLGLSATALGLFLFQVGLIAAQGNAIFPPGQRHLFAYMGLALEHYASDPITSSMILGLAGMTGFWLRRPNVVAEFERGKNATLAAFQRVIALFLVGTWGMTVAFTPAETKKVTPLLPSNKILHSTPLKKPKVKTTQHRNANTRAMRSAAERISA